MDTPTSLPSSSPTATVPSPNKAEPVKKDAAAAKQLPLLFANLADFTSLLDKAKAAGGEHLNVRNVHLTIGGDDAVHLPHDKKAWGELFVKDLEASIAGIKAKISALGFDPG